MVFMDVLFSKIKEVTGLGDIGYHKFDGDELKPVYKTNTDILGIEKWKETHAENPVYISETKVLIEVINTKKPVFINNTKGNNLSADAFFLFGVDSIVIFPIASGEKVEGIICVVSIGKTHEFNVQEVSKCESLVKEYQEQFLSIQ
jgi:acetolactate synthase-1/2/3 large subunit